MRLVIVVLLAAGLGLTSTACTVCAPQFAVDCASSDDCPVGFVCQQRLCVASVVDAGAAVDANAGDGGLADAVRTDRGGDAASADHATVDGAGIDQAAVDGAVADTSTAEAGVADAGVFVDAAGDAAQLESGSPDLPAFDAGVGPALFAIHPAIGKTGDRLVFEGIFPAGALRVEFAATYYEVSSSPATNRLQVWVPAGAGTGPARVIIDGVPSNSVPFRYTTFAPRLGYFSSSYEQTLAARSMPALTHPRVRGIPLVTSRYVYLIGGAADGASPRTRTRARIYADGTLGKFVLETGSFELAERRSGAAVALVGDRLYLLGGDGGETLRTVEMATVDPAGELSLFTAGPELPAALQDAEALVVGRYLYLIGGRHIDDPDLSLRDVIRAPIGTDFSLGPFEHHSQLVNARDRVAAAVVGDRLYVFGGTNANGSAESAVIEADGDLLEFSEYLVDFTPRRSAAIAVFPGELCLIGGEEGDSPIPSVQCSAIATDDNLGRFMDRGALAVARTSTAAAVAHNRLYLLGGGTEVVNSEVRLADLLQAPINFGANLGPFSVQDATPLPAAMRDMACAVVGDKLYLTGGNPSDVNTGIDAVASADVVRFAVTGDGELMQDGAIENSALDQPRAGHRLAVTGSQLIAIAGEDDGGKLSTVFACDLVDDAPGLTWTERETLAAGRSHFAAAIVGDRLYIAGGQGVSNEPTAAVNHTDLAVSSWSTPPGLQVARSAVGSAVRGSSFYVVAGAGGPTGALASVEMASDSGSGLGTFGAAGFSTTVSRAAPMLAVLGDRLYIMGGFTYAGPAVVELSSIEAAVPDGSGTWNSTRSSTATLPAGVTRGACAIELGNYLHLLGGWNGSSSTRQHWAARIE